MYSFIVEYMVLASIVANLMCAVMLAVLMIFVPAIGERRLYGKYTWVIFGLVSVLFFSPLFFECNRSALVLYNSHIMMWVVPFQALMGARNFRHHYGRFRQFLNDAWPEALFLVFMISASTLLLRGTWYETYGLQIKIVTMLFFSIFTFSLLVSLVRIYQGLSGIVETSVEEPKEIWRFRGAHDFKMILNVVFFGDCVVLVITIVNFLFLTEETFLMLVMGISIYNVALAFLILVSDITGSDIISVNSTFQSYIKQEIASRDAYYSREYNTLAERLSILEKNVELCAARERKTRERQKNAVEGASESASADKNVQNSLPEEVDSLICAALNIWIQNRGYCKHDVNLDRLAVLIGTNRSYLSRCINDHWGVGFSIFLARLRVDEACRLMSEQKYMSLMSVAYACGYNDSSSFTRCFKQILKVSPTVWKKAQGRQQQNPEEAETESAEASSEIS